MASVQAADDNGCQDLMLLSLQESQEGAASDNTERRCLMRGEQAVVRHSIRKGQKALSICEGHRDASICQAEADVDRGSLGSTTGDKNPHRSKTATVNKESWAFQMLVTAPWASKALQGTRTTTWPSFRMGDVGTNTGEHDYLMFCQKHLYCHVSEQDSRYFRTFSPRKVWS